MYFSDPKHQKFLFSFGGIFLFSFFIFFFLS
nr:MAG TPA: hypothetical protein [Bacteriophage sp.]